MSLVGPNLQVRLVSRGIGVGPDGRDACRFNIEVPDTQYGALVFAFDCDWVAPEEGGLALGKAALTIGADILDKLATELRATADYGDPFSFSDQSRT